ncbi:MAG TPA: hypothetical protein VFQ26_06425 [Nitrospiraceae bacterium]|nr:hypothetical protein [Nitrospiraceae bacterium]
MELVIVGGGMWYVYDTVKHTSMSGLKILEDVQTKYLAEVERLSDVKKDASAVETDMSRVTDAIEDAKARCKAAIDKYDAQCWLIKHLEEDVAKLQKVKTEREGTAKELSELQKKACRPIETAAELDRVQTAIGKKCPK